MEKQELVKVQGSIPAFVKNATESIDGMMTYAQTLLDSKLCPAHFYEKLPDKKPDYSKGNPAAVVMVLQHGMEVGLSPMQSLQQVVPVNGLISIKGDGAKSLIFRSGILEPGSWKETFSGGISTGDYSVTITAKRKDNGMVKSTTFNVDLAKRAGLWIDSSKISGPDGWKYKQSAWYKYPDRMVYYRALGFIARDLFIDVLAGMYTSEEAQDMPQDTTTIIQTGDGAQIKIPDKEFNAERSKALSHRATEKINERNKPPQAQGDVPPEAKTPATEDHSDPRDRAAADEKALYPLTEDEAISPSKEKQDTVGDQYIEQYTEEELMQMEIKDILAICEAIPDMKTAMDARPGKNTNKKLRQIILNYQKGLLGQDEVTEVEFEEAPPQEEEMQLDEMEQRSEDIEPNEEFEKEAPEAEETPVQEKVHHPATNPYDIDVPELPESGNREFSDAARLYGAMNAITPPLGDKRFLEVAASLSTVKGKYNDKEDFCKRAPVGDINFVLEKNKEF